MILLAIAGVVAGVLAWTLSQTGGSDTAAPSDEPSGVPSPAVSTATGSGGTPTGVPSANVGEGLRSAAPTTGATSSATADRTSKSPGTVSEILPSPSSRASATTGLPGLKPPRSTTTPLISAPLPRQATEKGALVTGYPHVLAPPAKHTITVSSVAPASTVLQVSLTASCQRPCAVLRHYRLKLAARGFAEVTVPSVENHPTASLQRGEDSVTVTVTGESTKSLTYTVFAVLHPAKA
jgi:hypothetical protein